MPNPCTEATIMVNAYVQNRQPPHIEVLTYRTKILGVNEKDPLISNDPTASLRVNINKNNA
ncbi:MAG: hypothetical protein ACOVLC_11840 [Flavobacterium sp.]